MRVRGGVCLFFTPGAVKSHKLALQTVAAVVEGAAIHRTGVTSQDDGRNKGGIGIRKSARPRDESQEGDMDSQEESETQMTDAFGSLPADESHQQEEEEEEEEQKEPKKGVKGAKRKGKKEPPTPKPKKKKAAKVEVEICTERDQLERRSLPSGGASNSFTVLSWNVNGLRATVRNGLAVLRRVVETERPDLVCFQVGLLIVKKRRGYR